MTEFRLASHFIQLQSTFKQHDLLRFQRTITVVSRFSPRVSFSDGKKSRPGNDNELPRNSSTSIELFFPKTRRFGESFGQIPIIANQQGILQMMEEVLASVGAQDMDTNGYELSVL